LWAFATGLATEGSVYADPRLPLLVLLSALVPVMRGLESINIELAVRNLQLQYMPLVEIGAMVIQILAMIGFAMLSPTVWALMAGMLTGAAARVVISHKLIPGPDMGLAWDREIAARLWHFGKWIMGSSSFTFVAVNADRFILAALLNAATFGIYVIAQIWVAAGEMVISRLSDQVGFPAVSEMIRTRPDDVPRLFRKLQSAIDVICVAAFLFMFFGGQLLIDFLYTPTYAEAGRYLEILSVAFLGLRFMTLNAFGEKPK
jgi:O-antigen/teichoic acid export membrane protein